MSNCNGESYLNESAYRGATVELSYGLNPLSDMTDWTCSVDVVSTSGDVKITKSLTILSTDTFKRQGYLTSAETLSLTKGTYTLVATLSNSTTDRVGIVHNELEILG